MNIFWENYKVAIVISAYIFLLVCIFEFGILPLKESINEKRIEAAKKVLDYEIDEKRVMEIPRLKEKVDLIEESMPKLEIFIAEGDELLIIENIEKLSLDTGNEVKIEIANGAGEKQKNQAPKSDVENSENGEFGLYGDKYLSVRLDIKGSFNEVFNLINKLENFDYISDIVSIRLSKVEAKSQARSSLVERQTTNFLENRTDLVQEKEGEGVNEKNESVDALIDMVFYFKK